MSYQAWHCDGPLLWRVENTADNTPNHFIDLLKPSVIIALENSDGGRKEGVREHLAELAPYVALELDGSTLKLGGRTLDEARRGEVLLEILQQLILGVAL